MSNESGHARQRAPSRSLVRGKKLGQGSRDKLGEHLLSPPLPTSEHQGGHLESLAEFHKSPLGTRMGCVRGDAEIVGRAGQLCQESAGRQTDKIS